MMIILKYACIHDVEIAKMTLRPVKTWNPSLLLKRLGGFYFL